MFRKVLSSTVIVCFFLTTLGPYPKAHADTVLGLPQPGTMVNLSPAYVPLMLSGLTVHPENPLLIDFIVSTGNSNIQKDQIKNESDRLIKYFLACLTIPEDEQWVNLSPYEKDRIIPAALGQTALGRDMLAQDYLLKQLTASLIYPEKNLGKDFWNNVYAQAQEMFGTTNVPVNTFNKVWILPDVSKVYTHHNTVFVVKSHLKVMLDEDYLAMQKHISKGPMASTNTHSIASQIVRRIILPAIEKEVNTGKNFTTLRQIYNSMILSVWYKKNLKEALLNQVYANKKKIGGVTLEDKTIKDKIYQQYLQAYRKGVFNYIKEDIDQASNQVVARKYFSGGEKPVTEVDNNGTSFEAALAEKRDGRFFGENISLAMVGTLAARTTTSAAMINITPDVGLRPDNEAYNDRVSFPSQEKNMAKFGEVKMPVAVAMDIVLSFIRKISTQEMANSWIKDSEGKLQPAITLIFKQDRNFRNALTVLKSLAGISLQVKGEILYTFRPGTRDILINNPAEFPSETGLRQLSIIDAYREYALAILEDFQAYLQQHRSAAMVSANDWGRFLNAGDPELRGSVPVEIMQALNQEGLEVLEPIFISLSEFFRAGDDIKRTQTITQIKSVLESKRPKQTKILFPFEIEALESLEVFLETGQASDKTKAIQALTIGPERRGSAFLNALSSLAKYFNSCPPSAAVSQPALKYLESSDDQLTTTAAMTAEKVIDFKRDVNATDLTITGVDGKSFTIPYGFRRGYDHRAIFPDDLDHIGHEPSKLFIYEGGLVSVEYGPEVSEIEKRRFLHSFLIFDGKAHFLDKFNTEDPLLTGLFSKFWGRKENDLPIRQFTSKYWKPLDEEKGDKRIIFKPQSDNFSAAIMMNIVQRYLPPSLSFREFLQYLREKAEEESRSVPVPAQIPEKIAVQALTASMTRLNVDEIMRDWEQLKARSLQVIQERQETGVLGQQVAKEREALVEKIESIPGIEIGEIPGLKISITGGILISRLRGAVGKLSVLSSDWVRNQVEAIFSKIAEQREDVVRRQIHTPINEAMASRAMTNKRLSSILVSSRRSIGHSVAAPGGIDLNAKNMTMESEGEKIDIRFNNAMIAQFEKGNFSGIKFRVLDVVPINMGLILGL